MEIQGLTPVDTLYEFAGYAIGHRLSEYLVWTWIFPTLIISAALLRLLYLAYHKDSFLELAMYPLYVIFIAFLIWPIEVNVTTPVPWGETGLEQRNLQSSVIDAQTGRMRIPRILALVHTLSDALVRNVVFEMEPNFRDVAFIWQRVGMVNQEARILDADLREHFMNYVEQCYWPALASGKEAGWKNLPLLEDERTLHAYDELGTTYYDRDLAPVPVSCNTIRKPLRMRLVKHMRDDDFHQEAVRAIASLPREGEIVRNPGTFGEFYLRRMIYNETFGAQGRNEVSVVRKALPEYRWYKEEFQGTSGKDSPGVIASAIIAGVSSLVEWWTQEALGPTTYYRVSSFAPYLYGLISSILLMGFPIAALWSFLPRGWSALVNHLKLFLSVKIWPVFWAFLSRMNIDRGRFNPDDPGGFEGTFGQGEMFAALAGMYLLVPVLSYMLVSIVSHAGVVTMGALVGPGQTASGTPAAAASHAARSAMTS